MSVKGLVSSGLGTKLLGVLGLAGTGAGVSVPITMGYFRGENSQDVFASIRAKHDSIQGVLDRTKRASEKLALGETLSAVSSKVESMKELDKTLTENERAWRVEMTKYFSEKDEEIKKRNLGLQRKVSELKTLRNRILTEMARAVPDPQSIGHRK